MRIASLDRRITIQQRSVDRDARGQQVDDWTDFLEVWAAIAPLSGREIYAAEAVQSEVTHQITIRWRPDLVDVRSLTRMRIMFGTRLFDITSAINTNEENCWIVMKANEGLKKG